MFIVLALLYLFVIGAVVGSFIGAMVWRVRRGKRLVNDRSECESCHHKLAWYDLVPIVSWVWLRGRCRYCKAAIGSTPFFLELMSGGLFTVSFLVWPYGFSNLWGVSYFVLWLVVLCGLIFLFVYDAKYFILPDAVVWPLVYVCLAMFVAVGLQKTTWQYVMIDAVLALLPVAGLYWLLHRVSGGKWVGFGDVKLGMAIGFLVGWQGALLVMFFANLLGTLYVIPGLIAGKFSVKKHIPFGPFLILATVFVFLFGQRFIAVYQSFLHL